MEYYSVNAPILKQVVSDHDLWEVSQVVPNQEMSDEMFALEFPQGTRYNDLNEKGFVREHVVGVEDKVLKHTSRPKDRKLWGDGVLPEEGSKAPNVELLSLTGNKPEHLADYEGKVVVLTFWATWSGPCQQKMAYLQHYPAAHPTWKDKVAH